MENGAQGTLSAIVVVVVVLVVLVVLVARVAVVQVGVVVEICQICLKYVCYHSNCWKICPKEGVIDFWQRSRSAVLDVTRRHQAVAVGKHKKVEVRA